MVAGLCATLVVGCSSDNGDDSTTTTAGGGSTTTPTGAPGAGVTENVLTQFAQRLSGSEFEEATIECIIDVQRTAIEDELKSEPLDKLYQDRCDLTLNQVVASAYYSAFVERGVPVVAARCVRDLYGALSLTQGEDLQNDRAAAEALLRGCDIDPAIFDEE